MIYFGIYFINDDGAKHNVFIKKRISLGSSRFNNGFDFVEAKWAFKRDGFGKK